MLDSLAQFGGALAHLLSGWGVLNVFWATLLGIVIGALPGRTSRRSSFSSASMSARSTAAAAAPFS
jgi:TctA family transporter